MSATDQASRLRRLPHIALLSVLVLAVMLFAVDRGAAWRHVPDADDTRVALYVTEWCPYCKALRVYLDGRSIDYAAYDVAHSMDGALGFWALRGRGVPIAVIGPSVVRGFDLAAVDAALANLKRGVHTVHARTRLHTPAPTEP